MITLVRTYFLLFFLFINTSIEAQESSYRFVNFSYKDGLKDKFFYDITSDNNGILWIAAGSGLYSYTGRDFVLYKPSQVIQENSSNFINTVYKDKKGLIWTAGIISLQWFNPVTKKFIYPGNNATGYAELGQSYISHFFEDTKGNMWASTKKNGIANINQKDSSVRFLKPNNHKGALANMFSKIIETPDKRLWALSANGLILFSKEKGIEHTYTFIRKNEFFNKDNFLRDGFYDYEFNCIWLATFSGILKFDIEKLQFEHFNVHQPLNDNNVAGVSVISNKNKNELWFCDGNLCTFNKITKKTVARIVRNELNEFGFTNTIIKKIFTDVEGNLWLCAYNGLSQLPWQNNQWKTIPLKDYKTGSYIEPITICDIPGTSDLLISSEYEKGLCRLNIMNGKTTFIPFKVANQPLPITAVARQYDKIFATTGNEIYLFDSNQNSFQPLSLKNKEMKLQGPFYHITVDNNDHIYLQSPQNGFYIINTTSLKVLHYNLWDLDPSIYGEENNIYPSTVDSKKSLWLTKARYTFCLQENGLIIKFPKLNFLHDLIEDNQGHYWASSKSNGIFELWYDNKKTWHTRNYFTGNTQEMPSDYVMSIKKDKTGILWFGTLSGLVKFDPIQKKIMSVFRKKHGLLNDNVDVNISIVQNDKIVVCNYSALNVLEIAQYKNNKFAPLPLLESFQVMGKDIPITPNKDTTISLSYNQNYFQFKMAAISYNNSDENTFFYKLDGADKDWIISNRNYVTYSGLNSRKYLFHFKCANNDGIKSNKEIKIGIEIKPPFWRTWWFFLLLFTPFVTLIIFLYRSKIKHIRQEEELKNSFSMQLANMEMKALRAQMNPHFIFNTLNSIQKYIFDKDVMSASQYLTRFSRLIRLILNQSNQSTIRLTTEIEMLRLYITIESMRFEDKFRFVISVAEDLDIEHIEIPSMLIQPYVENAIWHGLNNKSTTGLLQLNFFRQDPTNITVTIEDDGIGRSKAMELKKNDALKEKSFGIEITRTRMELIGKLTSSYSLCHIVDLKDDKGNATGTRVILTIPLINKGTYD